MIDGSSVAKVSSGAHVNDASERTLYKGRQQKENDSVFRARFCYFRRDNIFGALGLVFVSALSTGSFRISIGVRAKSPRT